MGLHTSRWWVEQYYWAFTQVAGCLGRNQFVSHYSPVSGVAWIFRCCLPKNQPLIGGSDDVGRFVFSLKFFGITFALSVNSARKLQVVGKIMAPVLVIVLLSIAGRAVFLLKELLDCPMSTWKQTLTWTISRLVFRRAIKR